MREDCLPKVSGVSREQIRLFHNDFTGKLK